jgi:hypothetical protein
VTDNDEVDNFITLEMVEAANARDEVWTTCAKHGVVTDARHSCGICWEERYEIEHPFRMPLNLEALS